MAYLPPAGVRLLTANKRTDLIYGVEVPNNIHLAGRSRVPKNVNTKPLPIDVSHLPASSVKAEDWRIPESSIHGNRVCRMHGNNAGPDSVNFMANDYISRAKKRQVTGGTKYPGNASYEVRIKSDQQTRWQNEVIRIFGINCAWEEVYGKRYHYNNCSRCSSEKRVRHDNKKPASISQWESDE